MARTLEQLLRFHLPSPGTKVCFVECSASDAELAGMGSFSIGPIWIWASPLLTPASAHCASLRASNWIHWAQPYKGWR